MSISDRYHAWLMMRRRRIISRRERQLEAEACRRIQVKEYKWNVYLCFDGVPLVDIDYVKLEGGIPWLLSEAHRIYKDYKRQQLWKNGETTGVSGER